MVIYHIINSNQAVVRCNMTLGREDALALPLGRAEKAVGLGPSSDEGQLKTKG